MRRRSRSFVVALALAASGIGIAGCGGGGGGGCGAPLSIAGSWTGTLQDNNCGNGTFKVSFSQTSCSIGGVWSSDFSIPACDELGTLQGDLDDTSLDVRLTPNGSGCSFDVAGVVSGVDQITGNYTPRGDCQVSGGGTFEISRDTPSTPTPGPTATPTP